MRKWDGAEKSILAAVLVIIVPFKKRKDKKRKETRPISDIVTRCGVSFAHFATLISLANKETNLLIIFEKSKLDVENKYIFHR